ncbi:hypothetical protein BV898_05193 [Hypsibius exemplaris]|uniref:Uncharacterized protein n=1 Tax=Hypsibius exemplaris TaxID=2072580 RepID=A0A1W0X059_HYPEX|nr:hypothetical protein BV898_05193 [Hypsibius exemplaris]
MGKGALREELVAESLSNNALISPGNMDTTVGEDSGEDKIDKISFTFISTNCSPDSSSRMRVPGGLSEKNLRARWGELIKLIIQLLHLVDG